MTTETSVDQKLGAFHMGSCSVVCVLAGERLLVGKAKIQMMMIVFTLK